jgi:hypothetical protein
MDTPSHAYLERALCWLAATTAIYLLMNGAQIFETVLIAYFAPTMKPEPA